MKQNITIGCIALICGCSAFAGTLVGTVNNVDGVALAGVMVRATEASGGGNSEMVFTDLQGRFKLKTSLQGSLNVRLRAPYYQDLLDSIDWNSGASLTRIYALKPMTDAQQISDSLPAGYHFGHLPFDAADGSPFTKPQFQRDCLTCHQIGNAFTRVPRPPEGWAGTVQRMHGYLGNFDPDLRMRRAQILSSGFDGKPLSVRPEFPVDPGIFTAKVYEYPLPRAITPHDASVSASDGLVYTVDQGADLMAVTNLTTLTTQYIPHPPQGAQAGRPGDMGASVLHGRQVVHHELIREAHRHLQSKNHAVGGIHQAGRPRHLSPHHPLRQSGHCVVYLGGKRAGRAARSKDSRSNADRLAASAFARRGGRHDSIWDRCQSDRWHRVVLAVVRRQDRPHRTQDAASEGIRITGQRTAPHALR
jgi:hypothetical protein